MMPPATDEPLTGRIGSLLRDLEPMAGHPCLGVVRTRLEAAFHTVSDQRRPLVVVLVGGTGVGKSSLFNALIGQRDASPVSHARRCFTTLPQLAAGEQDLALVPDLAAMGCERVATAPSGMILVDCPDLDGVVDENRRLAQDCLEMADLVLFLASPDKEADRAPLAVLEAQRNRTRILAVATKADQRQASMEVFLERMRVSAGLAIERDHCFLVDANDLGAHDGPRLREQVLRPRGEDEIRVRRADARLGRIIHACDPRLLEQPRSTLTDCRRRLEQLQGQVRALMAEEIARPDNRAATDAILAQSLWQRLPDQARSPLVIPLLVHARLNGLRAAFGLWRWMGRGGPLALLHAAGGLVGMVRSLVGSHRLLTLVARTRHQDLDHIATSARRAAEDHGLRLPVSGTEGGDDEGPVTAFLTHLPVMARPLTAAWRSWARTGPPAERFATELTPAFSRILDRAVEHLSHGCIHPFHRLLSWLPALVVLHLAWRVGDGWIQGDWLPAGFYLHALLTVLLATVPAYLLVWLRVSSRLRSPAAMQALADGCGTMPMVGTLARINSIIDQRIDLLDRIKDLGDEAHAIRRITAEEHGDLGASG